MTLLNSCEATEASEADIHLVRVVRDPANRDGWTLRRLSDGKLGFIAEIDSVIQAISAGQLWEATITVDKPKFTIYTLIHKVKD